MVAETVLGNYEDTTVCSCPAKRFSCRRHLHCLGGQNHQGGGLNLGSIGDDPEWSIDRSAPMPHQQMVERCSANDLGIVAGFDEGGRERTTNGAGTDHGC